MLENYWCFHTTILSIITDSTIVSATTDNGKLLSDFTLSRRTLDRFRRNNPSNKICWDRHPDKDSFFSVIDTHNHFRPFGGPPVPFDTYFQWMQDAGILFSTMFGIGQKIKKKHQTGMLYLHVWGCVSVLTILWMGIVVQ